jgi:hypothetical protein
LGLVGSRALLGSLVGSRALLGLHRWQGIPRLSEASGR